MPKFIDLTGQQFERWTVIKRVENNKHNHPQWCCKCICGNEKIVAAKNLRSKESKSCGCLNKDVHRKVCIERNTKHNLSQTKTYNAWINIRQRCENPKCTAYKKYGAKGIKVCERWQSFDNFFVDMGHAPSNKHTLDRINPKGNYEPTNCRWALQKEQQNNRGNNRLITFNGKTKTLMQWAEQTGFARETIARRLDLLSWSVERALTQKPRRRNFF